MNTPLSWIKAYVPELECTDQEYMDAMTLSGTKCEGFENEWLGTALTEGREGFVESPVGTFGWVPPAGSFLSRQEAPQECGLRRR